MLPVTANDAVQAWESKQPIDAIPIMGGMPITEIALWARVFQLMKEFPAQRTNDKNETLPWTYSLGQFESWCFDKKIAWPKTSPAGVPLSTVEAGECYAIRGIAYAILREGFANVMNRRTANGAKKIVIQKTA